MMCRQQDRIRGFKGPMARRASQAGSTLVEFLIASLLTSVVMGAMYHVYRVQGHSVKLQEGRLEAQEYARAALDLMVREMRNAALNPLGAVSGPALGMGCAGTPLLPALGAPGITAAEAGSISFTYDFQGGIGTPPSPDGSCDDPEEKITYAYDPSGCPSGLADIKRNGNPLTDCNVTALEFRYFKQDGTELARPVVATELPNIQRVWITLSARSTKVDTEFGGPFVATMSSNVDLRNRGLSS